MSRSIVLANIEDDIVEKTGIVLYLEHHRTIYKQHSCIIYSYCVYILHYISISMKSDIRVIYVYSRIQDYIYAE